MSTAPGPAAGGGFLFAGIRRRVQNVWMNTRRQFLQTLGLFTILPGAGRIWKAQRSLPDTYISISEYAKYLNSQTAAYDKLIQLMPVVWDHSGIWNIQNHVYNKIPGPAFASPGCVD